MGPQAEAKVDFYDVKGDVEALLAPRKPVFEPAEHPAMHPGRCARVLLDGQSIGFIGELHPQWRQQWDLAQAPVLFELELDAVLAREVPVFKPVAKHQAVERDIAVVVNEKATHAQLMQAVEAAQTGGLLRSAVLFDVYRPKALKAGETAAPGALAQDEKSLAVRLTLGNDDSSLTDVQIEQAVQAVLEQLQQRLGATPARLMRRRHAVKGDPVMELTVESLDSPALTKAQLADLLFDEIGLNKRESKDMVDAFFELISQSLVTGEDVKLSGFGNFQIRTKAPRPGATRARARPFRSRHAAS